MRCWFRGQEWFCHCFGVVSRSRFPFWFFFCPVLCCWWCRLRRRRRCRPGAVISVRGASQSQPPSSDSTQLLPPTLDRNPRLETHEGAKYHNEGIYAQEFNFTVTFNYTRRMNETGEGGGTGETTLSTRCTYYYYCLT